MSEPSVDQLLAEARACGIERLDAHLLLAHTLSRPRTWLAAHGDAVPNAAQAAAFRAGVARRGSGEPLAYLLGEWAFHGLTLSVGPQVLVPRPETELLVDWALELLTRRSGPAAVLDLGTGSGAIALAVARACPTARVSALDASPQALALAGANGERLGLAVEWLLSDWWSVIGTRRFDLLLSNPPYIAAGDAHLADLRHEPVQALSAGEDGLADLRRVAEGAAEHLEPGGWLLMEHGFDQAHAVQGLLAAAGLSEVQTRLDLAGHPRCTGGRR